MPEGFMEAYNVINRILSYGMMAGCWSNYNSKEQNTILAEFNKLEKNVNESVHFKTYGHYSHLVHSLFHQVKTDFDNVVEKDRHV